MAGIIQNVMQRATQGLHRQTTTTGILSGLGSGSGLGSLGSNLGLSGIGTGANISKIGTGAIVTAVRTKVTGATGSGSGILSKLGSGGLLSTVKSKIPTSTASQIIIPATPTTRAAQRGFAAKIG
jgi:hypothetical protein